MKSNVAELPRLEKNKTHEIILISGNIYKKYEIRIE
jgi:hypothetical protein